ncbi:predicted protein [Naegleria gruberi]|uniref:Predicted protein n=1 Tax=Naegleria gruberi TaxID=5762 RepID=D2W104_NAEGR|nr:uncharacterized protein NAEGRDRAFT_75043 [Naegleria gruberi]EFC37232.1 predicted protein [Naegleria gruberi]|eukprot:XP_002669976.1 predicted protein [Naegleria gruberi strain NEG-M]
MSKHSNTEKYPLLTTTSQHASTLRKSIYYKPSSKESKSNRRSLSTRAKNSTLISNTNSSDFQIRRNSNEMFSNDILWEIFSYLSIERIELLDSIDSKVLVSNLSALAKLGSACQQFRNVMNESKCWDVLFEHYVFFCSGEYHGLANPMLYYKAQRNKFGDMILTSCQKKHFVMYGIMFDYIRKRQLFSSQFMSGLVNKTIHSIDFKHYPQRNIIRATKSSNSHIDPLFAKRCLRNRIESPENNKQNHEVSPITSFSMRILCGSICGAIFSPYA